MNGRAARIGRRIALASLLLLAGPPSAAAQASDRAELETRRQALESLRSRVAALQREIDAGESRRAEATDALAASERAISTADRRLYELTQDRVRLKRFPSPNRGAKPPRWSRSCPLSSSGLPGCWSSSTPAGMPRRSSFSCRAGTYRDVARLVVYYRYIGQARADLIARFRADRLRVAALHDKLLRVAADPGVGLQPAGAGKTLAAERAVRAAVALRMARAIDRQRRELGTSSATRLGSRAWSRAWRNRPGFSAACGADLGDSWVFAAALLA